MIKAQLPGGHFDCEFVGSYFPEVGSFALICVEVGLIETKVTKHRIIRGPIFKNSTGHILLGMAMDWIWVGLVGPNPYFYADLDSLQIYRV